jgi:hypothetical protein
MRQDISGEDQRCSVRLQAANAADGGLGKGRRVGRHPLDRLARSTRDLLNLLGTVAESDAAGDRQLDLESIRDANGSVDTGWLNAGLEYVYTRRDVFGGTAATAPVGAGYGVANRLVAAATVRF